MFIQPYSDEYMTYDSATHRYTLTRKGAEKLDMEIVTQLKNPEDIEGILEDISDDVYEFIHEHSIYNREQDFMLAVTDTGRRLIKKAMEKQLLYVSAVGDTTLFLDKDKRGMYIAEKTKKTLLNEIPEFGMSVLYTGSFRIRVPEEF